DSSDAIQGRTVESSCARGNLIVFSHSSTETDQLAFCFSRCLADSNAARNAAVPARFQGAATGQTRPGIMGATKRGCCSPSAFTVMDVTNEWASLYRPRMSNSLT